MRGGREKGGKKEAETSERLTTTRGKTQPRRTIGTINNSMKLQATEKIHFSS